MRTFLFVLSLCSSMAWAQTNRYEIQGQVQGIPEGTVLNLLQNSHGTGMVIDTVVVKEGKFYLAGEAEGELPIHLSLSSFESDGPAGRAGIWLEEDGGAVDISGEGRLLAGWMVEGHGPEQEALNFLQSTTRELNQVMDSLNKIRNSYVYALIDGKDDKDYRHLTKVMDEKSDSLSRIITPLKFKQIQAQPNSRSAVKELYYMAKFHADEVGGQAAIESVYDQLVSPYDQLLYAQGVQSALANLDIPQEGESMVNVTARDLEGKTHELAEFMSERKYLLLDFWSLGCGPCIMAAPELRALKEKYTDKLTIVGFNLDTKKQWWAEATERDSVTWVNLSDLKGTFAGAAAQYGVQGLPTYILIDPTGKIALRWSGFGEGIFEKKLSSYLN